VVLVEGVNGIKNLDKIANVKGIDVIYVGTYDLSQALGIPDQVDSPEVIRSVKDCAGRIRARGIAAGVLAQNEADIERWLEMGIQFIPYTADCAILHQACSGIVNRFKTRSEQNHEERGRSVNTCSGRVRQG